jgi:hypothetical protein
MSKILEQNFCSKSHGSDHTDHGKRHLAAAGLEMQVFAQSKADSGLIENGTAIHAVIAGHSPRRRA